MFKVSVQSQDTGKADVKSTTKCKTGHNCPSPKKSLRVTKMVQKLSKRPCMSKVPRSGPRLVERFGQSGHLGSYTKSIRMSNIDFKTTEYLLPISIIRGSIALILAFSTHFGHTRKTLLQPLKRQSHGVRAYMAWSVVHSLPDTPAFHPRFH